MTDTSEQSVIAELCDDLYDQWDSNHFEHCGCRDEIDQLGLDERTPCYWPWPKALVRWASPKILEEVSPEARTLLAGLRGCDNTQALSP